jgi:3'-phosphoadenosine 5'-phosphosulfate sulfotransferase (PAPS reductase)/FAD synthetase
MSPLDRHKKIALSFSGGKDSLTVVWLLRDRLEDLTIYHLDTGDLLPEMRESVAWVERIAPHFVRVETKVNDWIVQNGMPTDLLPYTVHPVAEAMGEKHTRLVPRYDCCYSNLMMPLFARVCADGNTLMIRGTKRVDMPKLPVADGEVMNGVEFHYPLQDWTNEQVMAYLRDNGVPIPRVYEHAVNSPECARCSAWWNEGRAAYLKRHHPEIYRDYRARMEVVAAAIEVPLANLRRELGEH